MNRLLMIFILLIFIIVIGTRTEKLTVSDPTTVQGGSCWCCDCGWQSCKACAANRRQCCPGASQFTRYHFGNGDGRFNEWGGYGAYDDISLNYESLKEIEIKKKRLDEAIINNYSHKTIKSWNELTYQQKQELLDALEKAGIKPEQLSEEQMKAMLNEIKNGLKCNTA